MCVFFLFFVFNFFIILSIFLFVQMYIKREGSVEGPLWPRQIKEIVTAKFMKVMNIMHKFCTINIDSIFSILKASQGRRK